MSASRFAGAALIAFALGACERQKAAEPAPTPAIDAGPPVSPAVQLMRDADWALQTGDLARAIPLAEKSLALDPNNPLANNILGRAEAQKFAQGHDPKDAEKAEAAFKRALAANPDFWPVLQNLGELYEKQGRTDDAADAYQRLLVAQPNHPERHRMEMVIGSACHPDNIHSRFCLRLVEDGGSEAR